MALNELGDNVSKSSSAPKSDASLFNDGWKKLLRREEEPSKVKLN